MNRKLGPTVDRERVLLVRTACIAVVEECWMLRVPNTIAARLTAANQEALSLLDSQFVVSVDNVEVHDEQDRVVIDVTDVDGVALADSCGHLAWGPGFQLES